MHKKRPHDAAAETGAALSKKKLKSMFAEIDDAALLAEVDRRELTEKVRHAAIEAQVRANYEVGAVLGEGSSAKVYEATHLGTGDKFAIKWIDKGGEMNDAGSMAAELAILKSLHHKNIVNLHEVYESDSTLWLVMEVVAGGELLGYLSELKHLSEACVRDIAKQLCTGLHYIHSAGVVHRDMKLENVLRATTAPDACVKIADFGLAAMLPRFSKHTFVPGASVKLKASHRLKDMWGTPQYFAPELIDKAYGTQVDVWSMGCVLYELLTGHKLFGGDDLTDDFWEDDAAQSKLWADIHRGPDESAFGPDRWDADLSAACKDCILQMCAVDPTARCSAGQALSHPWISDKTGTVATTHHMKTAHGKLLKRQKHAKRKHKPAAGRVLRAHDGKRATRKPERYSAKK